MNVVTSVVDAFTNYFDEVRNARIAFWLKKPVSSNLEFVGGPITALAFLLARHFFDGVPSAATYGVLIIAYVVLTSFAAGVACLLIAPGRQPLGENMRKFISTAWIISTISAFVSVIDSLLDVTGGFAHLLLSAGLETPNPDLVATCVPSVLIALGIVAWMEHLLQPPFARDSHYIFAAVFFFLAGTGGLGLMIGAGRGP